MSERSKPGGLSASLAVTALIGLALGFGLGAITLKTQSPALLAMTSVAKPIGMLWTNALRMLVLPLMVSYLILAVNSARDTRAAGKLGAISLVCIVAYLAVAAFAGVVVSAMVIDFMPINDSTRAAFKALSTSAGHSLPAERAASGDFVSTLIPPNIFRAVVDENHVGLFITTALFAFAMTRIIPERRVALLQVVQAIAETTRTVLGWVMLVLPIAAFALAFSAGADSGFSVASGLGYAVLGLSLILLVLLALVYPVTALVGRVKLRRFASACAPAQMVAAGTRSSLASLPALLEGAVQRLGLRTDVAGFVLPLTVTTFKLNYLVSQPFKLLFLTSMLGLQLQPGFIVTFVATVFFLSFTTVGIPSGGQLLTWPLLMSAGIPVEALVMMKVVDAIPDIFKTILNVTADMSVATIVQRFTAPVRQAATVSVSPVPVREV